MRARAVALRGISRRGEGVRDPTHVRFCPKAPRSLLTRPDQVIIRSTAVHGTSRQIRILIAGDRFPNKSARFATVPMRRTDK
jgi:hypothetical protein